MAPISFLLNTFFVSIYIYIVFHLLFTDIIEFEYRTLSSNTKADDNTLLFEIVFIVVWIGGGVISINGSLLGGQISIF